MTSTQRKPVLSVNDWEPASVKYMPPKINDRGGKSIALISTQTNRSLHISTPLMMTWGISDFVDDKGESDGKYSISLNFPNEEYKTTVSEAFLTKLKALENQILDDAVKNSESWFGEEMSREVAKHTFFSFLKYSKNKETKKVDYTRPPSIRAKVPFYDGKWAVELYDTQSKMIFPCENAHVTPVDLVPKMSNVACVIQCSGIWVGGKGWGLTWKMIQCVVKPREIVSVYGKCHIELSQEEVDKIEKQEVKEDMMDEEHIDYVPPSTSKVVETTVDDSDDEKASSTVPPEPVIAPVTAPVTAPVEVVPPVKETDAPKKKKVVKKVAP
jgi:hypothetical protein